MEFLAKAAYYAGTVVSGLVLTFFFLASLVGPRLDGSGLRESAVIVVAGAAGYGLLYLAVRFGHRQHRWLTGLALALAALATAGALMIFGLLVFGKVHWQ